MIEEWHFPHQAQIGPGMTVRRSLPYRGGKGVGPFVFLDHMGPVEHIIRPDRDVRPHPHIGLSTITYLYEGEMEHRDSLGSVQAIKPGDVNWMVAGSGIVHSERSPKEYHGQKKKLHGVQIWVALPKDDEDCDPSFQHFPSDSLPIFEENKVIIQLVAGELFGQKSPVVSQPGLLYAALEMRPFSSFDFETGEREYAFYLTSGKFSCEGRSFDSSGLLRFKKNTKIKISSDAITTGLFIGGPPLTEPRRIWWNFVSSSPEKIEAAKVRWREDQFPKVSGETERVPLPE